MWSIFLDLLLSFLYIQSISNQVLITSKMLSGIIEKSLNRYFGRQESGLTITGLPKDVCPICISLASQYKEVERIK